MEESDQRSPKEIYLDLTCASFLSGSMREIADGPFAQNLLDEVYDLLLRDGLRLDVRRKYQRYMLSLAEHTNMFPSRLLIQGVKRCGDHPISGGGFADIYQGIFHGKLVALKVLRVFVNGSNLKRIHKQFCREALVWWTLSHPNVLPFYGVCDKLFSPRLCMVAPWMTNGNILNYLEKHPQSDRLAMLRKIADGLMYLHQLTPPLIHGDLRGNNILVDDSGNPLLTDFGLTKTHESQGFPLGSHSPHIGGSTRWMAPELFGLLGLPEDAEDIFNNTPSSDVYSFGCLSLEIFTGRAPYSNVAKDGVLPLQICNGIRPPRPIGRIYDERGLSDPVWRLMQWCWSADAARRPSAAQVYQKLGELHRSRAPPQLVMDSNSTPIDILPLRSTLVDPRLSGVTSATPEISSNPIDTTLGGAVALPLDQRYSTPQSESPDTGFSGTLTSPLSRTGMGVAYIGDSMSDISDDVDKRSGSYEGSLIGDIDYNEKHTRSVDAIDAQQQGEDKENQGDPRPSYSFPKVPYANVTGTKRGLLSSLFHPNQEHLLVNDSDLRNCSSQDANVVERPNNQQLNSPALDYILENSTSTSIEAAGSWTPSSGGSQQGLESREYDSHFAIMRQLAASDERRRSQELTAHSNLPSESRQQPTRVAQLPNYPYLSAPPPPSTPRTIRRNMLSNELSRSLRLKLLWERQVSKQRPRRQVPAHGSINSA